MNDTLPPPTRVHAIAQCRALMLHHRITLDDIRAAGLDSDAHSQHLLEQHRAQAADDFKREAGGG